MISGTSPEIPVELLCSHTVVCPASFAGWHHCLLSHAIRAPCAESPYLVKLLPGYVVCNMNLHG